MTEILVLRGLPASGKTTYAMSLADTHARVSRDDIRQTLTGRSDKFAGDYKFEQDVTKIQESMVRSIVGTGRSVVIDDTNLRAKYAKRWVILANELGVESDVQNFKVPLDDLLKRNARRMDKVPESVIRDMYQRFPYKNWEPIHLPVMKEHTGGQYVRNPNLPPLVTVDLDGTLALHSSGRNPYDHTRYMEDTLNEPLADLLAFIKSAGVRVGVFTGRGEQHREVCEQWLSDMGVEYDFMLMRPADQPDRKDSEVKVEMFRQHVAPKYDHLHHWDDRDRVVDSLRSIGVLVGQVARGNF